MQDEVFINSLRSSGRVVCMVTEERPEAIVVHECKRKEKGAYVVVFDPLDGSSNIDCGVSIGTIFGIYKVQVCRTGTIRDWQSEMMPWVRT